VEFEEWQAIGALARSIRLAAWIRTMWPRDTAGCYEALEDAAAELAEALPRAPGADTISAWVTIPSISSSASSTTQTRLPSRWPDLQRDLQARLEQGRW